ncbi:MAG: NYN domain-containing protein [Leptospiraceae bacterium]|nr:NYN domain-containing protein [Leptospiraceae bacterium]
MYKLPELEEHMYLGRVDLAMEGLLEYLLRFRDGWKHALEMHVFFDGRRAPGDATRRSERDGLFLYYSHDLSADHLIAEFVNRHAKPADLRVVSSDKAVLEHARLHRAGRQTSEDFVRWVQDCTIPSSGEQSKESEASLDSDADYWKSVFLSEDPRSPHG